MFTLQFPARRLLQCLLMELPALWIPWPRMRLLTRSSKHHSLIKNYASGLIIDICTDSLNLREFDACL